MRLVIFISLFASSLMAENSVYTSQDFVLHLKEDSSFIFYPKEASLKTNVAGNFLIRNDSLLLTTHQIGNETAIFAIYTFDSLHLNLQYFQKEFALCLPQDFYISKTLYANQRIKHEYRWQHEKHGDFMRYTFSEEAYLLAIENFSLGQLEGTQLYYFHNPYVALKKELRFKAGQLHGKSYYFEALDNQFLQVQLIKEETYKAGELRKVKKPVVPPVFYTSHF